MRERSSVGKRRVVRCRRCPFAYTLFWIRERVASTKITDKVGELERGYPRKEGPDFSRQACTLMPIESPRARPGPRTPRARSEGCCSPYLRILPSAIAAKQWWQKKYQWPFDFILHYFFHGQILFCSNKESIESEAILFHYHYSPRWQTFSGENWSEDSSPTNFEVLLTQWLFYRAKELLFFITFLQSPEE